MKYIATRPRVEKLGSHGLFGDENTVNLGKTMEELDSYTGRVWTHILSLKREDAERLGFDNAHAWRDLLRRTVTWNPWSGTKHRWKMSPVWHGSCGRS